MFKNPLTFKGKISGMELFLSWVVFGILGIISLHFLFESLYSTLLTNIAIDKNMTLIIGNSIFYYLCCIILLAQTIKGCRSIDKNMFKLNNSRIRRTEYGLSGIIAGGFFIIFTIPLYFPSVVAIMNISQNMNISPNIPFTEYFLLAVFILTFLLILAFLLIQSVKRCHDFNESGWLCLIPIYNPFWLLFAEGTRGKNRFGEDPKQIIEKSETI